MFEQKSNNSITKMRKEIDNQLDTILKEFRPQKSASPVTNPSSETLESQNIKLLRSKVHKSIGVHASITEISDSEDEDYPVRPSGIRDLRLAAKPLYRNWLDLDATVVSNEDSEEEDYHKSGNHF